MDITDGIGCCLSLSLLLIRRMGTPNQSTPLFIPLPIDPCTEWILFCNTTFLAPRYRRRRRKKEKKRRRSWISYSAAVYYISLLLLLFSFFFVPDLFIMAWVNIDEGGAQQLLTGPLKIRSGHSSWRVFPPQISIPFSRGKRK